MKPSQIDMYNHKNHEQAPASHDFKPRVLDFLWSLKTPYKVLIFSFILSLQLSEIGPKMILPNFVASAYYFGKFRTPNNSGKRLGNNLHVTHMGIKTQIYCNWILVNLNTHDMKSLLYDKIKCAVNSIKAFNFLYDFMQESFTGI